MLLLLLVSQLICFQDLTDYQVSKSVMDSLANPGYQNEIELTEKQLRSLVEIRRELSTQRNESLEKFLDIQDELKASKQPLRSSQDRLDWIEEQMQEPGKECLEKIKECLSAEQIERIVQLGHWERLIVQSKTEFGTEFRPTNLNLRVIDFQAISQIDESINDTDLQEIQAAKADSYAELVNWRETTIYETLSQLRDIDSELLVEQIEAGELPEEILDQPIAEASILQWLKQAQYQPGKFGLTIHLQMEERFELDAIIKSSRANRRNIPTGIEEYLDDEHQAEMVEISNKVKDTFGERYYRAARTAYLKYKLENCRRFGILDLNIAALFAKEDQELVSQVERDLENVRREFAERRAEILTQYYAEVKELLSDEAREDWENLLGPTPTKYFAYWRR